MHLKVCLLVLHFLPGCVLGRFYTRAIFRAGLKASRGRKMKAARSIPLLLLLLLVAVLGPAICLFIRKHVFVDKKLNWTDAQTYCRANYVGLSTMTTDKEYKKYKADVPECDSQHCWLGLSSNDNGNNFRQWSDGRQLRFNKWKQGEPNYLDTEHCANSNNGEWYNTKCNMTLHFSCSTRETRMVVVQEVKSWPEALEHCRKFYTDLMSLNTNEDLSASNNKSLNFTTPSVWVGLRFLAGSWFWVNEEPLGNLVGLPSCPASPSFCGAKKVGTDTWENRDCEEKMNFICYQQ